jgi:hypothetical protein
MTNSDEGVWRDEEKLPLSELTQAMATYSQEGQADDLSGSDAGTDAGFGEGGSTERAGHDGAPGDPDATSAAGRGLRPSPDGTAADGRSGPH